MTPFILTIIGVGAGLAGLMIGLFVYLWADIAEHRKETGELRERIAHLEGLPERMAHFEGLLEGSREAIVSRAA